MLHRGDGAKKRGPFAMEEPATCRGCGGLFAAIISVERGMGCGG